MSEPVSVFDVVSSSAKIRSLSSDYADSVVNGTMSADKTRELLRKLQTLKAGWTSLGSAKVDKYHFKIGRHNNIANLFRSVSLAAERSILTKDTAQDTFISDAARVVGLIDIYEDGLRRVLPEETRPSEAHARAETLEPDWSLF